jgi:hypothetical protein
VRFSRNGPVPFDPRGADTVTGPGKVRSDGNRVLGDDTLFLSFFAPGDRLQARGQSRIVTQVTSNVELRVSSGFSPALPDDTEYAREGLEVEPRDGYSYVPDTRVSVLGGNTLMQLAGDFAAMLCLGAVPDMLDLAQQGIPGLAGKQSPANQPVDARVRPVYQVFRNWSLDRRRVNEWRMLVLGGAVSEKGRDPAARDAAMPLVDAAWTAAMADPAVAPRTADGERVSRVQGWVPLFRRWLDMAADPASNAADGTGAGPTNRDLSRAMAFLFDLPDPVPVHTP